MAVFDELEALARDLKNRLKLLEKVSHLFLGPIKDEINLQSQDVKNYLETSVEWTSYTTTTFQHQTPGDYDSEPLEVHANWSELNYNADDKIRVLILNIAACEGRRPEKLFDEIWPHRRDVIERLADVPTS